MAIPALELRPRGAVALFDAALRLCSRSSAAWALTLPGGSLVLWAALGLLDAVSLNEPLSVPAFLFAGAWVLRGVGQGAACHFLEEQLLSREPPRLGRSLRAALGRLPSLTLTAVYVAGFQVLSLGLSAGLASVLLPALTVAFAVTLKGQGHPLALYGTCSRALGAARRTAPAIRLLFGAWLLVALNLHVAANALIYLGRKVAGLDLTFAQRFASLDNQHWVAVVVLGAFVLFEPVRAAVATLLLVDGRVREEGLDLLAAVEQLPKRRSAKGVVAAMWIVLGALLLPGTVRAGDEGWRRLKDAAAACEYQHELLKEGAPGLERLGAPERAALLRLAQEIEGLAQDEEGCEAVSSRLEGALPLVTELSKAPGDDALAPSEHAKRILARPEFVPSTTRADAPDKKADELESVGWLARLKQWLEHRREPPPVSRFGGAGEAVANAVVVGLVGLVLVVLAVVLIESLRSKPGRRVRIDVVEEDAPSTAQAGPSALARPPEGWASLADDLALRGDFREAIRHLYLALLSRLHRSGAIDYDPHLSNWDYCRHFRGKRELLPTFRELTLQFDFAWYGQGRVEQEGYLGFRSLSRTILSPDGDEGDRA